MHLRVLYFNADGSESPQKNLTEATLPLASIVGLKRNAQACLALARTTRLRHVVSAITHERNKKKPLFLGMALIGCPSKADRKHVHPKYHLTIAGWVGHKDLVHGSFDCDSLKECKGLVEVMRKAMRAETLMIRKEERAAP